VCLSGMAGLILCQLCRSVLLCYIVCWYRLSHVRLWACHSRWLHLPWHCYLHHRLMWKVGHELNPRAALSKSIDFSWLSLHAAVSWIEAAVHQYYRHLADVPKFNKRPSTSYFLLTNMRCSCLSVTQFVPKSVQTHCTKTRPLTRVLV
jgi:hypothetical protein